jgi:hypothetical protein
MPEVGFELRITGSELAETVRALDRSATMTGIEYNYCIEIIIINSHNCKKLRKLNKFRE